jgi:hypothetical protein
MPGAGRPAAWPNRRSTGAGLGLMPRRKPRRPAAGESVADRYTHVLEAAHRAAAEQVAALVAGAGKRLVITTGVPWMFSGSPPQVSAFDSIE